MNQALKSQNKNLIILFDGFCNLCSKSVQFIIRRDPKAHFRFSSLQSETGKNLLKEYQLKGDQPDSVILIENGKVFDKSTAALRICRKLNNGWPLLSVFLLVPPFFRDYIYSWIAHNRYRWFGKRTVCWLPSEWDRGRFLEEGN